MTCEELTGFLDDYFDHLLSMRQRVVFFWHLSLCRDCRRYLDSYSKTVRLAQSFRIDPPHNQEHTVIPPPELIEAILATLARERTAGDGSIGAG
jgi:predicted anti-sigma-YlaC factor YlaD